MAQRILVVDDDRKIARLVASYLEGAGYIVLTAYDGDAAMHALRRERPDLVVLDWMLPGRDGWSITQWVRADATLAPTPILMLTARVDDSDKISSLETGADDYLTKPFNPLELVARVKALLRRAAGDYQPARVLESGDLRLDVDERAAYLNHSRVDLTPTEFNLLRALMQHPNHTFTRDELIESALGYGFDGMERTLDSHIRNLRKKLDDNPAEPRYIETVFGVGYRFREDAS
jgi:two-component system alkaline phosphatase synthesis response regulator PhoP